VEAFALKSSVATLLAVVLLAGCGRTKPPAAVPQAGKAAAVKVQPAQAGPIADSVETTGEVVALTSVAIMSTIEGIIGYCPWREGDTVDGPGVKLIEIDRPLLREEVKSAQAALKVAQARLADLKAGARPEEIAQVREMVAQLDETASFAKKDLDRVEKMVASSTLPGEHAEKARVMYVTTRTNLAAARERLAMLEAGPTSTEVAVQQALVDEAAARLDLTKARLAECTLVAPFAGIVSAVYVRRGDMASAKTLLIGMFDPASIAVRFAVPEAAASAVRTGMMATASLDALPGTPITATVSRVYPELDRRTRTLTVEAALNGTSGVVPGMFARVILPVKNVSDAITVPRSSIIVTPKGDTVLYVAAEGKVAQRTVKTGIEARDRVQVLRGVEAGESVVVAGNETLKDGMAVRVAEPEGGGSPGRKAPAEKGLPQ